MPIAINCMQMRRKLPPTRAFVLPEWFAWTANAVGLIYIIVTTVLFFFPPDLPVDSNNMNYCIVVFGIWMLICAIWWIVDGRKNYTGPRVQIDGNVITSTEVVPEAPTFLNKKISETAGSTYKDAGSSTLV